MAFSPFLGPLPLRFVVEEEDDDEEDDDDTRGFREATEQLSLLLFFTVSSSSMNICLHLHSTLQKAMSPLHQTDRKKFKSYRVY